MLVRCIGTLLTATALVVTSPSLSVSIAQDLTSVARTSGGSAQRADNARPVAARKQADRRVAAAAPTAECARLGCGSKFLLVGAAFGN